MERDRLQGQLRNLQVPAPTIPRTHPRHCTQLEHLDGDVRALECEERSVRFGWQDALGDAVEALDVSGKMAKAAESVREGVDHQARLLDELQIRLEQAHHQQV